MSFSFFGNYLSRGKINKNVWACEGPIRSISGRQEGDQEGATNWPSVQNVYTKGHERSYVNYLDLGPRDTYCNISFIGPISTTHGSTTAQVIVFILARGRRLKFYAILQLFHSLIFSF